MINTVLFKTRSLCPVCIKTIDATIVSKDDGVYMKKSCPAHGDFQSIVWKGSTPIENFILHKEKAAIKNPVTSIEKGCPYDCGLCAEHRQHTCTALIEVTQNCNLHCRFCFANSKSCTKKNPSVEQIRTLYKSVLQASGICNIQLSGGEPTVRDDLPLIIKIGKDLGFRFIQINTNGIRIAEEEKYVEELKTAGLDSLFLQFDGTSDSIYEQLRGRKLFEVKRKAIENCRKYGIGVVLVPTLVPKINTDNIGKILDFAFEHIDAVRGVHFQPVSYFGRVPHPPEDHDRITLAELMDEIEKQTNGRVKAKSFRPPGCENSLCSFHGKYLLNGGGKIIAIADNKSCCTKKAEEGALKAKVYVSRNWSSRNSYKEIANAEKSGWDKILSSIYNNSLTISAMAFQDVWNVDLNRVKGCCIHVVSPEGKLIPFCIYNITNTEGRSLYRSARPLDKGESE